MSSQIKDALMGCLEIPLFMKTGATRFQNTIQAAKTSFLVPILVIFPVAEVAKVNSDFTDHSYIWLLGFFAMMLALNMLFFFGASYACMVALEKKDKFPAYITSMNWLSLTSLVINMPFLLLVYFGIYSYDEMYNLFIFLILFGTTYQAFLITHLLRINWMLGAAISIMGILIDDGIRQLLFSL